MPGTFLVMRTRVETREVHEDERVALCREIALPISSDAACTQIPRGHVVPRVAKDVDVIEQRRGEVDPLLVCEEPSGEIVKAILAHTCRPPGEECTS